MPSDISPRRCTYRNLKNIYKGDIPYPLQLQVLASFTYTVARHLVPVWPMVNSSSTVTGRAASGQDASPNETLILFLQCQPSSRNTTQVSSHPSQPTMSEKIFSYAQFNLDALISLAAGLRGRECSCNVAAAPKTGSMNWAIFVSFDDGLDWVFRSPRRGHHAIVSDESAQKMLVSEVATLKFLRNNTSVPIPRVYSFRCDMTVPPHNYIHPLLTRCQWII